MNIKKGITPYNNNKQKHGYWEVYYWSSDKLWFKCVYHNGKRIGYEEDYRYNGKLIK